jgi:hypothetical protein
MLSFLFQFNMSKSSSLWLEDRLKGAMSAISEGMSVNRAPNDFSIPIRV